MAAPITFGVEFEFYVLVLRPNKADPMPEDPRQVQRDSFRSTNYHTYNTEHLVFSKMAQVLTSYGTPTATRYEHAEKAIPHGHWYITTDYSLKETEDVDPSYEYVCFELVSPALVFCPGNLAKVRQVLDILSKNFRIHTNIKSGLHVHVGHGYDGFKPRQLKRIAQFCWAFEPQLLSLHPDHRHGQANELLRPLRKEPPVSQICREEADRYDFALGLIQTLPTKRVLHRLQECESCNEILACFGGNRGGISFVNCMDPPSPQQGGKRTIEFRQHEGTVDPDRVINWVETVIGIVKFAENAPDVDFFNLVIQRHGRESWERQVADCPDPEEIPVIELLDQMGLHKQARYYDARLEGLPLPPEPPATSEAQQEGMLLLAPFPRPEETAETEPNQDPAATDSESESNGSSSRARSPPEIQPRQGLGLANPDPESESD